MICLVKQLTVVIPVNSSQGRFGQHPSMFIMFVTTWCWMQMEYRMAVRQVAHEDFLEGVRASLVDKDRKPAWLAAAQVGGVPQKQTATVDDGNQLPGNRFPVKHLFEALPADVASGLHLLA